MQELQELALRHGFNFRVVKYELGVIENDEGFCLPFVNIKEAKEWLDQHEK